MSLLQSHGTRALSLLIALSMPIAIEAQPLALSKEYIRLGGRVVAIEVQAPTGNPSFEGYACLSCREGYRTSNQYKRCRCSPRGWETTEGPEHRPGDRGAVAGSVRCAAGWSQGQGSGYRQCQQKRAGCSDSAEKDPGSEGRPRPPIE